MVEVPGVVLQPTGGQRPRELCLWPKTMGSSVGDRRKARRNSYSRNGTCRGKLAKVMISSGWQRRLTDETLGL